MENLDGTGLRQLTPYGLAQPHEIASAQWSPDGREIISETTQGRIFVTHPDGTGLTPIRLQTGTTRYFAFEPDWSPGGTQIVFCMYINGQEDIYAANADGSNLAQITNTPDVENGPDWGRSLARTSVLASPARAAAAGPGPPGPRHQRPRKRAPPPRPMAPMQRSTRLPGAPAAVASAAPRAREPGFTDCSPRSQFTDSPGYRQ